MDSPNVKTLIVTRAEGGLGDLLIAHVDAIKRQNRSDANRRYYDKNRDVIKAKAYCRAFMAGKIKNPRATTRDIYSDQLDFENCPIGRCS